MQLGWITSIVLYVIVDDNKQSTQVEETKKIQREALSVKSIKVDTKR